MFFSLSFFLPSSLSKNKIFKKSFFKRFYIFFFREKGREGEREGETSMCVRSSHLGFRKGKVEGASRAMDQERCPQTCNGTDGSSHGGWGAAAFRGVHLIATLYRLQM